MIQVMPNLHFKGDCRQAIDLYAKAFGAEVKVLLSYAQANPKDFVMDDAARKDWVYHAEIVIGSHRLMLSDTTEDAYTAGNAFSLLVHFDTADEINAAYAALMDGATIINPMQSQTYCAYIASLVDRYGMRWELMAG